MKQVSAERYLGMYLSATAADSVVTTVNKRIGLATRAIYEARAIVEDKRSDIIGGLVASFEIFERSIVPMILSGSEIWTPLPKKVLKKLDALTVKHLRLTLGLGKKAGLISAMYWSTGTLYMSNRILLNKVLFVFHLANLSEGLAKDFYDIQVSNSNLPSVVSECQTYFAEWNLNDIISYTKSQFRKIVKDKIFHKNRLECLQSMRGLKKINMDKCSEEKFELNNFYKTLNVKESRLCFKIKYFLTPTISTNFKNDKKFKSQKYLCQDCIVKSKTDSFQGHEDS